VPYPIGHVDRAHDSGHHGVVSTWSKRLAVALVPFGLLVATGVVLSRGPSVTVERPRRSASPAIVTGPSAVPASILAAVRDAPASFGIGQHNPYLEAATTLGTLKTRAPMTANSIALSGFDDAAPVYALFYKGTFGIGTCPPGKDCAAHDRAMLLIDAGGRIVQEMAWDSKKSSAADGVPFSSALDG
jgi:hypothetical protein